MGALPPGGHTSRPASWEKEGKKQIRNFALGAIWWASDPLLQSRQHLLGAEEQEVSVRVRV